MDGEKSKMMMNGGRVGGWKEEEGRTDEFFLHFFRPSPRGSRPTGRSADGKEMDGMIKWGGGGGEEYGGRDGWMDDQTVEKKKEDVGEEG